MISIAKDPHVYQSTHSRMKMTSFNEKTIVLYTTGNDLRLWRNDPHHCSRKLKFLLPLLENRDIIDNVGFLLRSLIGVLRNLSLFICNRSFSVAVPGPEPLMGGRVYCDLQFQRGYSSACRGRHAHRSMSDWVTFHPYAGIPQIEKEKRRIGERKGWGKGGGKGTGSKSKREQKNCDVANLLLIVFAFHN